jgi:hypothetical protein
MPEIKSSGQNVVNLLICLFIVYFMKLLALQLTQLQKLELSVSNELKEFGSKLTFSIFTWGYLGKPREKC